jgi:hypothetical protein
MPTKITGQNGAVIEQSTKVAIQGCPKHTTSKLAKALTTCRGKHKRDRAARASCERAARRRYGKKSKSPKA